ncbi:MAG: Hpt domain-containing protein [Clostridia bacterium]|nr:Hpt domain-containing protein [Clostridia bacterium]
MMTLDALREYGANVDEGLQRCMNMEAFYLRMIGLARDSLKVDELKAALDRGDQETAFELAHGMKGALLNVALTPLARPIAEMSDALKAHKDMDYGPLMEEILRERDRFVALF